MSAVDINFGLVIDIDGVILRGGSVIPGAKETIQKIASLNIPHVFVTNNGMETEAMRAARLAKNLGMPLQGDQFILCHSALKSEAASIRDGLVLVTGYCHINSIELMQGLGFRNIHTIDEYVACHPLLYPFRKYTDIKDRDWADDAVKAIVVLETSLNWAQDIQIICDLMMHNGYTVKNDHSQQQPKLIGCNFDFTYVGGHETARLGPGAFVLALQTIYRQLSDGDELDFVKHGKPHWPTYKVAEERLQQQLQKMHRHSNLTRIYAIGDNPQSDVRGANNAGDHWTSILVRTGCFEGAENDPNDPADHVVRDLSESLKLIFSLERRL